MKKLNAVLTVLIMVLFLLHAMFGSMVMVGAGYNSLKFLAWACIGLIVLHTLIGLKYTIDTIRICRKTKAPYLRENSLFWARRISGLAIMVLLCFHIAAFGETVNGVFRLKPFTAARLITQILLVLSLVLHIITNIRPLLIAMGAGRLKFYENDILIVFSIILLIFIAVFIFYFIRWQAI